jgi:hypothetical protein
LSNRAGHSQLLASASKNFGMPHAHTGLRGGRFVASGNALPSVTALEFVEFFKPLLPWN